MLSEAVEQALLAALEAHAGQARKAGGSPYVVHPLHVALIVTRWGQDDETVQAALLHDVVEDCEGWSEQRTRQEFGDTVASVVGELTEDKSRSWEERKENAVAHICDLSERACTVKAADKLHNLSSLALALANAEETASIWERFHGGRERTIEMDRRMVEALCARLADGPATELRRALQQVEQVA